MTKYQEILRLKSLGISEREIATSCSVSRNTVARVCKRAAELNIQWPLDPLIESNCESVYSTAILCDTSTILII